MKTFNIISAFIALIISILLIMLVGMLSSCNRKIAVTKRHYMDGYNISMADKHSLKAKEKAPANTLKSYVPDEVTPAKPVQDIRLPENDAPQLASEVKIQRPAAGHSHIIANRVNAVKKVIKGESPVRVFEGNNTAAYQADEGGNIVWTIIAILIVVWLISLLTGGWGLGWLIYIFLVVALILLLLRLLRIIIV